MSEEWTPTEMYQHLKEAITKVGNKALGTEQHKNKHKNKYLEKVSDELKKMIKRKNGSSISG
ncbi:MAG: hypothetical protein ACTS45_01305 [Candidatus Hodgkinia cicadicola]